jgi:hypothetical protein
LKPLEPLGRNRRSKFRALAAVARLGVIGALALPTHGCLFEKLLGIDDYAVRKGGAAGDAGVGATVVGCEAWDAGCDPIVPAPDADPPDARPSCDPEACEPLDCQTARCEDDACAWDPVEAGSDCADGQGLCKSGGVCVPSPCSNEAQDFDETDVDCGGDRCAPCGLGKSCDSTSDCGVDFACTPHPETTELLCFPANCSDGERNRQETDADCGGAECVNRCSVGQECKDDSDCEGAHCVVSLDSLNHPGSVGVCCGSKCDGPCRSCQLGSGACVLSGAGNPDPKSECPEDNNLCTAGGRCASCVDGVPNFSQGETDRDCGGGICGLCSTDGSGCVAASYCECEEGLRDCKSGLCEAGQCVPPRCTNNLLDGAETDVDCGGPCGSTCAEGESCQDKVDCASGSCVEGRCAP